MANGPNSKLRYSVRAWVAILSVSTGPISLIGLFLIKIEPSNSQTLGLVLGLVLGWGGAVVTSQFQAPGSGPKSGS